MPSITMDSDLYNRITQAAKESKKSADELISEATRRYLWELNRHKISEETAIYRSKHAVLKEKYLGNYIAMQHGKVVDQDQDFQALRDRIRQQYKNEAVMITLVSETAETSLVRRGFRYK